MAQFSDYIVDNQKQVTTTVVENKEMTIAATKMGEMTTAAVKIKEAATTTTKIKDDVAPWNLQALDLLHQWIPLLLVV